MNQPDSMQSVVVSPNPADVELTCALLRDAGIPAAGFADLLPLAELLLERAGCAVVVEESLSPEHLDRLSDVMRHQPPWCDFPLIIISGTDTEPTTMVERLFPYSGNVTLLSRPLSPATLISTVRVALRARSRQYEVRRLLDEREQSLRRRDEFLAMLAHELRNPLAPIRNAAHMMKMLKIDDSTFVKCRTMVDRQVVHLTRMVNDLLEVSRLELGKIQLQTQRVQLNSIVTAAVDACSDSINTRRHRTHLELSSAPVPIDGDPVRLEQVVCNLVNNAVKYTPPGGTITIATRVQDGQAVLSVADTGMGISAGLEQRIFELFRQDARTLDRAEGGLGIGLTVARHLIHLHGGAISASSEGLNKGSCFTVTLPLAKPEDVPASVPDPLHHGSANARRVLIVEDNQDIRESLDVLLKMWGHEVFFAETGPDGLKQALEIGPEVAIVDIGLPGMTGYDVAREIRRSTSSRTKPMKLVAMTGYGQQSDVASAREAGFDTHLLKPVDPDLLARVIGG